jgi:hypothetical protein
MSYDMNDDTTGTELTEKEKQAVEEHALQQRAIQVVQEMASNQEVLFGDDDREYVLGLSYLVEMETPIPTSEYPKLQKLYVKFQQYQVL